MESNKTKETLHFFLSSPNGMFLSSLNSCILSSNEIREATGHSVVFWYLDIDILNKKYGGVMNCLNKLSEYPGVCSVDILPIEGCFIGKFDDLMNILMQYVYGVI